MPEIRKFPSVPEPLGDLEGVRETVSALKQIIEVLARQRRKNVLDSAVTFQDLIDLELIVLDQVPAHD